MDSGQIENGQFNMLRQNRIMNKPSDFLLVLYELNHMHIYCGSSDGTFPSFGNLIYPGFESPFIISHKIDEGKRK